MQTTESTGGGPSRWVTKRAADGGQAARMAREIEILAAARHPGLVEAVATETGPDGPVLVTALVGPSLAQAPPAGLEEVAGVVAAVAATLADLADLGLVHGSVVADHVLVGPEGRPVLCGLGYGGRTGEPPVAEAPVAEGFADPARSPGDPLSPAGDVWSLGVLLRLLVVEGAGAPPGRRGRGPNRGPAAALLAVADRATVPDPRLRLSARALASAIGHAVPGARLPAAGDRARGERPDGHPAPGPARPGPPVAVSAPLRRPPAPVSSSPPAPSVTGGAAAGSARRRQGAGADHLPEAGGPGSGRQPPSSGRRRPPRVAALVLVATTVLGAGVVWSLSLSGRRPSRRPSAATGLPAALPDAPAPPVPSSIPTPPSAPGGTVAAGAVPTVPDTAGGCAPVSATLSADVDGDGCPDALRWEGGVIESGSTRWAVGAPGDVVATGDWRCSGADTLAVLRPATGDVFVFDGWAPEGSDLVAAPAVRVDGGYALRAATVDGGRCPELVVDRRDGPMVTVPVARGTG